MTVLAKLPGNGRDSKISVQLLTRKKNMYWEIFSPVKYMLMIVLGCGSIVTEVFVKPICSFLTVVSQSYENKLGTGHFRGGMHVLLRKWQWKKNAEDPKCVGNYQILHRFNIIIKK